MRDVAHMISWARSYAHSVQAGAQWVENVSGRGYWEATSRQQLWGMVARAVAVLEFFRLYAGEDSEWTKRAVAVYQSHGDNQSTETGVYALGDLLRAWADQVESGVISVRGADSSVLREMASTDIMEQVRRLLDGNLIHPAAPILLAGAALEIALRGAVEERNLTVDRPSISAYAQALRRDGILTAQEMKDIEQMSGLRNAAAHGKFDELSKQRAGLMEQQVNLFLARLREALTPELALPGEHPPEPQPE